MRAEGASLLKECGSGIQAVQQGERHIVPFNGGPSNVFFPGQSNLVGVMLFFWDCSSIGF